MTTVDEHLEHFGVKGMKWGVRKDRSPGANPGRTDKQWQRDAHTYAIRKQVYKATMRDMSKTGMDKINNDPRFKGKNLRGRDANSEALRNAYFSEIQKAWDRSLNANSNKLLGDSPSGKYRLEFSQDIWTQARPRAMIVTTNVKHSDNTWPVDLTLNGLGQIVSMSMSDSAMNGMAEANNMGHNSPDLLEHFGIKGMKWGVRRTQAEIHGDAAAAKSAHDKAKKHGTSSLSNKELQDLIVRMNLEKQYNQVVPTSKGTRAARAGSKFAADILVGVAKSQVTKLASDHATKLITAALKK